MKMIPSKNHYSFRIYQQFPTIAHVKFIFLIEKVQLSNLKTNKKKYKMRLKISKASSAFFLLTIFLHGSLVKSANILFFFGVSTYSHKLLVWPLVESLASRGHNVTFFSPSPSATLTKDSKIHEFSPKDLQEWHQHSFGNKSDFLSVRMNNGHTAAWHQMLPVLATTVCEIVLGSEESLEWVKSSNFDLVIIDALFNDCGLGLAWKFQASHIIFGTCTVFMWQPDAHGFPSETSWIPDASMDLSPQMSFLQRVSNTIRPVLWHLYRNYIMYPKMDKQFRLAFNTPEMPSLSDIAENTSLVLQNIHFSLDYPRSLPPLVVPVGGMHLTKSFTPIPEDMKKFLDASGDQGFIYVSFGSVVQMPKMPPKMKQVFISTFSNSSMNFLWKYDFDSSFEIPEELPKNVFSSKWIPQQSVLQHPNIKGFITHGGILSIEEAVYNEIPLIVMPVFADQGFNSENIVRRGFGIEIHFKDVNQSILESSINELVTNQKYKKSVVEISKLFKDRPIEPLEKAVWWVEYVLRNPTSGKYLRPLAISQTWFNRRLLDVWAFISLISFIILMFFLALFLSIANATYKMFFKNSKKYERSDDANRSNNNNNNSSPISKSEKENKKSK